MSVIILVVGILATVAALVTLGFGIFANELSLGPTLIIAGTTGLAGGLVLIALAAAVSTLVRIAELLSVRPIVRPEQVQRQEGSTTVEPRLVEAEPEMPRPAERRPIEPGPEMRPPEPLPKETRPAPDAALDVSASAIERLRSSIARPPKPEVVAEAENVALSPGAPLPKSAQNGAGHQTSAAGDTPNRDSGSAADSPKGKRLDFLFRSRSTRQEPAEPSVPQWPQRSAREPVNGPQVVPAPGAAKAEEQTTLEAPQADSARAPPAPVPPQRSPEQRSVAILKSGVVDGMAYTLYADGSIEAQLPQGTVRFGSITELRAHIENNS